MIDEATGTKLPGDRLAGQAFCALLETLPADLLPIHGGSATTVVVTIDLQTMTTGLGRATFLNDATNASPSRGGAGATGSTGRGGRSGVGLSNGTPITADHARRLACTANLVPAVLGARSEILDLGRTSRLFTKAQRLKMALEHPTCATTGCTIPATMCEAHHWRQPWAQGGTTNHDDGKLLCPWHHHKAHDPAHTTQHLPNGDVRFHKRH